MEKIIEKIDLKSFLVAIHEYLASIGANRSNNDDLGMRIAKTLVNEIVKLKKDSIWKYFEVIEKSYVNINVNYNDVVDSLILNNKSVSMDNLLTLSSVIAANFPIKI